MPSQDQLVVKQHDPSPVSEAFRTLRTNIQFSKFEGGLHSLIFTSAGPQEGKSTVVANTAIVMAQSGKKVIILDCDLRKPSQHQIFTLKNRGLTNLLAGESAIEELLQPVGVDNLRVLTSGLIPPNPSELLGSSSMLNLLAYLNSHCDLLLIDTPPIIAVTDACVLASRVDGVALVVRAGFTRPGMVRQAKELVLHANGKLLGVVLNRVEIQKQYSNYYYYYGSNHSKQVGQGKFYC
ncbi:MAG TPA: capsular biosynthesis protein [Firmicutes bacterium]|jgi:capsular exopolysaccharide synthesis family protein|nr:capsular biosynthesis protein [Bacillota bacterium]